MSAHEQFADDLALLALEALQGDERVTLEKHLEGCSSCRRELERLRGDMALLALSASGPAPPRRSRERLLKAIAKEPEHRRLGPPADLHGRSCPGWQQQCLYWWRASSGSRATVWPRGWPVAGRIGATAGAARACTGSGVHADFDGRAACDTGGSAGSAAAAGQSDLRAGTFESDFPGQQHASLPPQKAYELWLIPTNGAPIPAGSVQARCPWQRDCG